VLVGRLFTERIVKGDELLDMQFKVDDRWFKEVII